MLAIKYCQLVANTYDPDTVGYDLIRDLILVLRARLIPGLSKFNRRRTLEAGVEITISAGRFDIITCT